MRRSGGGAIVNVASSVGAHATVPGLGAYAASKSAVSALTRTAAKEVIADGIRVNALGPGPVDTPMSRLPGESDDERDARLASWASASQRPYGIWDVIWSTTTRVAYRGVPGGSTSTW
jgi:NAD(P)-dependent dehydrogenase (short-subunit alcohol dehydrogenase family)